MQGNRLPIGLRAALAMFTVSWLATSTWAATTKTLHSFSLNHNGNRDGAYPQASLIFDTAGNLYGTTEEGGAYAGGTAFELTPDGSGGWTETVVHNFGSGADGVTPLAGLIFDAAGDLYGTTFDGGDYGNGTVFELTPNGSGGWTETVLHNFQNTSLGADGIFPRAGLVFDGAGNLYGTTEWGGAYTYGTVFELTPIAGGGWTEKVLHSFGNGTDGAFPEAGLIVDPAGNLYGTTIEGGDYCIADGTGCGTVFELRPNGHGGWREKKLHNFQDTPDGAYPEAGLILDTAGNLYGTTAGGGDYGSGTVFQMTPNGRGGWTEKKLHNFRNNGTDGVTPQAELIFDAAGNLYGTTAGGGDYGDGTVFQMTPNGSGGWTEKKLHNCDRHGTIPQAGLIFDAAGNLYGTTYSGGVYHYGTVFETTP